MRLAMAAVYSAGVFCFLPGPGSAQQGVRETVHNLSAGGSGAIISDTEPEVCVFCHTPHGSDPAQRAIWNRALSGATYVPYQSPSAQAAIGQPTGDSKLCLSCHDGTIAIGSLLNLRGQPGSLVLLGANPDGSMPPGGTLIGTDLLNDHPVSFRFDAALASDDGGLMDPGTLSGPVGLRPGSNPMVSDAVQCTSCHDPHTNQLPNFLRVGIMGRNGNLCLSCHAKPGWSGSTHESSNLFWPGDQTNDRVSDHSCVACHTPHTSDGAERLLVGGAVAGQSAIEETCYRCHSSSTTGGIAHNIADEFAKAFGHPITMNPGSHRPVFPARPPTGLPENVLLDPGSVAEDPRYTDEVHVECVDCHDPHRVSASNRTEGMRGIGITGSEIANVINDPAPADGQASDRQYPVCLRCHGDTYADVLGTLPLLSGAIPGNKRIEFRTSNSSFHPVAGPGRNGSANLDAQLAGAGLSTNSVIKCTDCHNSDSYEGTLGRVPSTGLTASTPVGPHGSSYGSILRANFQNTLPGPSSWNATNFNLCFQCHNETMLMARDWADGARTNFYDNSGKDNLHWLHLDDRVSKSQPICQSCHYNIHSNEQTLNTQYRIDGIVFTSPPPNTPTRLINFHPNIRATGARALPEWRLDTTTGTRRCYLECHADNGSPGGDVMVGVDHFYTGPPSGDVP